MNEFLMSFWQTYNTLFYTVLVHGMLALSIYITLACGQLSLGNAAFMGIGAYTAALFTMKLNAPFGLSLLAGGMLPAFVALERFPFDSVLCAASVLDHFVLSFAEEFLPVAKARGIPVAGMKIMGLGALAKYYDKALRYAFGLPIATAVVGMESMDQLKKNLAVAEKYKPLTDNERLALFKEILPFVIPQNMPWKAEDWNDPREWKRR